MQSSFIINRVVLICLLLLPLFGDDAAAQSNRDLAQLYEAGKISELHTLLKGGRIQDPGWSYFVEAIFLNDAEAAVGKMNNAYALTTHKRLKSLIRRRIAKYYEARGYYISAQRVLEDEAYFLKMMSARNDEDIERVSEEAQKARGIYGVQIGAFGDYDNALRMKADYEKEYKTTKVVEKERDGKKMFLVVVGGFSTRDEAEKIVASIKDRFKTNGYIVQY